MGYSQDTEIPRGRFFDSFVTNNPEDVGTPGVDLKIASIHIKGGIDPENLIFRNSTGSVVYLNIPVGAQEHIVIPRGWQTAGGGLEVLTLTAAIGLGVTMFYYQ